eukprot:gene41228-biopygen48016
MRYERYVALARCPGTQARIRNMQFCNETIRRLDEAQEKSDTAAAVNANRIEFEVAPPIKEWIEQEFHDKGGTKTRGEIWRSAILYIEGLSRMMKSSFAKWLPTTWGDPEGLVVQVGGLAYFPDSMRAFQRPNRSTGTGHGCIVADDNHDVAHVDKNQHLVQGVYDRESDMMTRVPEVAQRRADGGALICGHVDPQSMHGTERRRPHHTVPADRRGPVSAPRGRADEAHFLTVGRSCRRACHGRTEQQRGVSAPRRRAAAADGGRHHRACRVMGWGWAM